MPASLHTFIDIFGSAFDVDGTMISLSRIVIPMIQRDYAQGRSGAEASRVRNRFLQALHDAFTDKPITLDFVYGDMDADGIMTPLDGQQRLTTLFLLHWYAAKKCGIPAEKYAFLKNFSYETRYSARDFCAALLEFQPSFGQKLSAEIMDQVWFPFDWQKDPTICAMLIMLDAIQNVFSDIPDLWEQLENGVISFCFLPLPDMGLTDALYIKMNSRGKPLTQFEHFKAELERELRQFDEDTADRIAAKIDGAWTDLLWQYRASDHTIDDGFLRYFRYVCDLICYLEDGSLHGKEYDEFELIKLYFSHDAPRCREHIAMLESFFDCWNVTEKPTEIFAKFISQRHEAGKICCDHTADLLGYCLRTPNRMMLSRFVLLYAFICYMQNREKITEAEFSRRLRMLHNLIRNSEDEISDRQNRNRMPNIIRQTAHIILHGTISSEITNSFNAFQIREENEKLHWTQEHPDQAEGLFALEDHRLLQGQIAVIGLENAELFSGFEPLFQCSRDAVDCALMSIGMYWKAVTHWCFQSGTGSDHDHAWQELFHHSERTASLLSSADAEVGSFENTKRVLTELLSRTDHFSDAFLRSTAETYLRECEERSVFDWRYYYLKYPVFRPFSYGVYSKGTLDNNPYEYLVMQTKLRWSRNTYQPFLKALDDQHLDGDDCGRSLVLGNLAVYCGNRGYEIWDIETEQIVEEIEIKQNEHGIDTEDRIAKMQPIYQELLAEYQSAE